MKFKNIVLGTMLTLALVCGTVAAYPEVKVAEIASENGQWREM